MAGRLTAAASRKLHARALAAQFRITGSLYPDDWERAELAALRQELGLPQPAESIPEAAAEQASMESERDWDEWTIQEIAEEIGVSPARVHEIINRALGKLRRAGRKYRALRELADLPSEYRWWEDPEAIARMKQWQKNTPEARLRREQEEQKLQRERDRARIDFEATEAERRELERAFREQVSRKRLWPRRTQPLPNPSPSAWQKPSRPECEKPIRGMVIGTHIMPAPPPPSLRIVDDDTPWGRFVETVRWFQDRNWIGIGIVGNDTISRP